MADAAAPKKSGGSMLAWLLVVVLLGAVFWLASERNARKWSLAVEGGLIVVQKGRFFPTGARTISATDPEGKAYAPFAVPAGAKVAEAEFDDRVALDHALFDQLLPWAKAAAEKLDGESQKTAMALAERASYLPGLSPSQLDQLASLRGDLAYTAAIGELQLAAGLVESARRRLSLAQQHGGSRSLQAGALSQELKTIADRLGDMTLGKGPILPSASGADPVRVEAAPAVASPAAASAAPPAAAARDAGVPDGGR